MTTTAAAERRPSADLRFNTAWMFLGQSGYALGQWAMLVILAHLGGPVLVGEFSLALAITGPIVVFSQLQMREIQVVAAGGGRPFSDFWALRLTTTSLALAAIAALAAFGGYPRHVAMVILAVGLVRAVETLSDIHYGLTQRHEQIGLVARSLLIRSVGGCAALGLVLALSGSLVAALAAQAAAWAATWWLFDRRVTWRWRRLEAPAPGGSAALRRRGQLAWLGLPLGISLLLTTLNLNVPRYVIERVLDFEALGIFAALAHIVFTGSTVLNAACQAASPRLASLFAAHDLAAFRRLLLRLVAFGAAVGLLGMVVVLPLREPLLRLLYGEAFAAHADLLVWVMTMGLVSYTLTPLSYSLSAMHRFRVQPVLQGIAVAVNLVACLVLVPSYGLAGALGAWTLAFAAAGLMNFAAQIRPLWRDAPSGAGGPAPAAPAGTPQRPLAP